MPYNTVNFSGMGLKAEQFANGAVLAIGSGKLTTRWTVAVINLKGTPNGVVRFLARHKGKFWRAVFDPHNDNLLLEQGLKPDPHEELRKALGLPKDQTYVDEENLWAV